MQTLEQLLKEEHRTKKCIFLFQLCKRNPISLPSVLVKTCSCSMYIYLIAIAISVYRRFTEPHWCVQFSMNEVNMNGNKRYTFTQQMGIYFLDQDFKWAIYIRWKWHLCTGTLAPNTKQKYTIKHAFTVIFTWIYRFFFSFGKRNFYWLMPYNSINFYLALNATYFTYACMQRANKRRKIFQ